MRTLLLLIMHVLTTLAKRMSPGGAKALIAESLLVKHQLQIAHRSCGKMPRQTTMALSSYWQVLMSIRFIFGNWYRLAARLSRRF